MGFSSNQTSKVYERNTEKRDKIFSLDFTQFDITAVLKGYSFKDVQHLQNYKKRINCELFLPFMSLVYAEHNTAKWLES